MKGGRGGPRPPPTPSRSSCGQSIAASLVKRSGASSSLRSGREPSRRDPTLQERDELSALAGKGVSLGRGQRLATFHRKCDTRVSLNAAHEHLEMEMRRRSKASHADESDGLTNLDSRATPRRSGKAAKVTV